VKYEVLRVKPRSALRVGFWVGLLGGFVFGLLEVLFFRAMSAGGGGDVLPAGAQELVNSGGGGLLLVAVVTSLISSLVFALAGALTAVFYNLGARLFGGIELFLSEPPVEPTRPAESDAEDGRDG
jgi:Na+/proline symporter